MLDFRVFTPHVVLGYDILGKLAEAFFKITEFGSGGC